MKNLTTLLAVLTVIAANAVSAGPIKPLHGGFLEDLGNAASSTDIIQFNCGAAPAGVTINQARARVKDKSPVAQPALNVQIAVYTGGACGAYTAAKKDDTSTTGAAQAYGLNSPDNNLIFSDWTATVAMPAVGGKYCIKVTKTADNQNTGAGGTAVGAENYEIDSHCEQNGVAAHNASTAVLPYIQDQ